ncbi:hypothetical protein SODALDRAFT_325516 [Sodiomyces alkalinus F11]|uniref:Homeobox domain-containing protein n=1 Tax=Sodiomyces alkalinus (strain CBS 110278 / VKM F-3762 / F11) TaxID=1314773 RepID=A0A3N2PR27_SODAK|nr:hypothetical protein SODALDRAFT_325516 [Sodiomyces alkalinus F11]ROT36961.1 hypothetical protein SODALDRAFT_325516 [Sodiomyces alkalinus F11]
MEYFPNNFAAVYHYAPYNHGQYPMNHAIPYHRNAEPWQPEALIHHDHHGGRTTESKPRLAKEEVDKLEREFQRNNKPNSNLKKQLAEEMRVDVARINNWFQNRRAKAKQERRTQENEVRRKSEQASDKSDDDAVQEYYPDGDHHDDLRPSAAPFPPLSAPSSSGNLDSSNRPAKTDQNPSEDAELEQESCNSDAFQSLNPSFQDYCSTDSMSYTPDSCDFSSMASSRFDQHHHGTVGISLPERFPSVARAPSNTALYGSFSGFGGAAQLGDDFASLTAHSASSITSADVDGGLVTDQVGVEGGIDLDQLSPDSAHSPMSTGPGAQFKSPAIDIASRRNTKRPAQLGLGCMRSSSYNLSGIKTNADMSRRMEIPSPMRRVASATGGLPRGIQKPVSAAPRSPMFFDRNQETMLLQMASRTPAASTPHSSAAPPTPNTPILGTHHEMVEPEASTTSPSSGQDKSCLFQADMMGNPFQLDPTMRTPPDTPGLAHHFPGAVFPSQPPLAGYGYNVTDEPLVTPVLGRFDAEYPTLSTGLAAYVMQNSGSQPSTPSFGPSSAMGPAFYLPYAGGNTEYNWSDTSDHSPPGHSRTKQFQFTNMTPQDFHGERC